MTKLHLWLCFFRLACCYGLTRAPSTLQVSSNSEVFDADLAVTSEQLESSSVYPTTYFTTTTIFTTEPSSQAQNVTVGLNGTPTTVEKTSAQTSPQKTAIIITETNNSQELNYTTTEYDESILCTSVSNLSVESAENRTTKIVWELEGNSSNSICFSFDANNDSSIDNRNCSSYFCENATTFTEYYLSLCSYQEYKISVQVNCDLDGSVSKISTFYKTDPGEPSVPLKFTVAINDSSSLLLSWLPPKEPNGPIDGYGLRYFKSDNPDDEWFNSTEDTSYYLRGLENGSSYNISLYAFNFHSNQTLKSPAVEEYVVMPELPSPPENLSAAEVTNTSITITWNLPKKSKGIKYLIKWANETEVTISPSVGRYKISNLQPFFNYSIVVSAWRNDEEGQSLVLYVRTDVSAPGPPRNMTIQLTFPQALLVSWDEPLVSKGPIHGYFIIWKSENNLADETIVSGETQNLYITNLTPYSNYSIRIFAFNNNFKNETLVSEEVLNYALTSAHVPSAPLNFVVHEKYYSYLLVMWSSPEVRNGPINGYRLSWWKTNASAVVNLSTTADITEQYYYINDLQPWTNYTIRVLAFNLNRLGEKLLGSPSILYNRTLAKIPEPPVVVGTTVLSPFSVHIKWSMGDDICPGPTNYTVEVWENPDKCTGKERHLFRNYKEGLTSWDANSAVMEDLKPHTVYSFRIVASTYAGSSFSNFSRTAVTLSDVPGPPQNFRVNCSESPISVTIKWESPKERNGDITEYRINYGTETNELPRYKVVTTEPESTCERLPHSTKVLNLRPEMNYRFAIQAKTLGVNRHGPSTKYTEKCILPAGIPPMPQNSSNVEVQIPDQEEVTIVWSQNMFSSKMGRIVSYSVIVANHENIGLPRSGNLARAGELPTWSEFWKERSNSYQATPMYWNPFAENAYDPLNCQKIFNLSEFDAYLRCTIGWEKNCSSDVKEYCNGRLKPGKQYGLKIRGFTRGGFSETYPIMVVTAPPDQKGQIVLPIALMCVFLMIISIGGCYFFLVKRRATKGPIMNELMVLFRKPSMRNTEPTIAMSSATNGTPKVEAKPPRSMNFTTFLEHIKIMTSDSDLKFSLEYEELKQNSPRHPCTAAALEENRPKNRWMNIFPFDHSRVKLLPIDDEPGSDYINASYIPGFSSHREYIASQGPLPQTVDDFWRMVWEQKISMIVMLTQCVERGKTKCEQYWPTEDEYVYHGDLKVQKKSVSILPEYTIRIFDLILGTRQRTVNQMHFTRWPDFGCPESPEELINFVRAVRAHLSHENTGPILVHCSAGVGRTGTFIAVDRLLQYIQYHNFVDIYGTVMDMRDHRINMVQTENQYIYIHKCIKQLILEKLELCSSREQLDDNAYSNIDHKTFIEQV